MNNKLNGGVITPSKLNVWALQYLKAFSKCFNDLSEYYDISEGFLCLKYDSAQEYIKLYTNCQELKFYKDNQSRLGWMPRMIELEAILPENKLQDNIVASAKSEAKNVNISNILQIVEPADLPTYYVPFDAFLNATRIVKYYVEATLCYEHHEKLLLGADNCVRSLKSYYSLMNELGITVKRELTISNPLKKAK